MQKLSKSLDFGKASLWLGFIIHVLTRLKFPFLQKFPADADTAKLIPEAVTNVWTMQIDHRKKQFMYQLERNNQLRYRGFLTSM